MVKTQSITSVNKTPKLQSEQEKKGNAAPLLLACLANETHAHT